MIEEVKTKANFHGSEWKDPPGNLTTFPNIYGKPRVTISVFESILKGIQMITRLQS